LAASYGEQKGEQSRYLHRKRLLGRFFAVTSGPAANVVWICPIS
jgi:hypothetical protein